jgi:hypothetical protein
MAVSSLCDGRAAKTQGGRQVISRSFSLFCTRTRIFFCKALDTSKLSANLTSVSLFRNAYLFLPKRSLAAAGLRLWERRLNSSAYHRVWQHGTCKMGNSTFLFSEQSATTSTAPVDHPCPRTFATPGMNNARCLLRDKHAGIEARPQKRFIKQ